jgi:hypothetical protein
MMELLLDIVCAQCGSELVIYKETYKYAHIVVQLEPCDACIDAAKDDLELELRKDD